MSDNGKIETSKEFQKVEQTPQDTQGAKITKSLDTSSTYVNLKRIVSNLTNKDGSTTKDK